MDVISVLVRIALVLVGLKLLVWWLEPRMAFFPIRGVQETPAAAGVPFRDLKIHTADGQTLHGWWLERSDPRAQVVFFHGNGGNLSLWLDILIELHRRGFSVLAVDYRGYGASTGRPSEQGLYADADAALRTFNERLRRAEAPVVYWGRSIGAAVAAYAVSVQPPDAVVLETPMPDVRSVLRTNPVLWALSFLSSYRFPTSRFLAGYRGPLLVVHGDRDSIVPFGAGRQVYERAPSSHKQFLAISGADHNDLHVVDPGRYWDSVNRFVLSLSRR
jgi:fermentation-respiration switch protein FrsA (DUF1100 family)